MRTLCDHAGMYLASMTTRAYRALIVLAVLAALAGGVSAVSAQNTDEAGVRAAIEQYFKGHSTRDAATMRAAFLPTAHIEGVRQGRFTSWTVDEYTTNFTGTPAPNEASNRRTIDSIDIEGTAAMARATLVHGRTTFTDYFVLLKVDGEWKIANKVYSAAPTAER